MKSIRITSVLITAFVMILSGCNNKDNKMQKEALRIGAIIPLTGEVATYGESLKKGFEMAVDEDSVRFEIIYEDSKADKNTGISAINKLISSDIVKFIFSDATSGVTLAIAPIAEKNKVILFDAIATSDAIIKSGDYVFRNAPSNFKQATKAVTFIIKDLNVRDIAIIYNQTDYGINLSEKFKSELDSLNIIPVFEASYQDGTVDFKTMLSNLKSSGAKTVFVPGNYEETANILKQARQIGITIPFVGTDGAYSPKLIEIAGSASDNFYLTMMGVDESSEMYQNYVLKYRSKYHTEPDVFSSYGYEAAKILFSSIKIAGYNSEKVKEYLYSNTFPSLTGKLNFDQDGEVIRDYVILKVINGSFSQ
ncbi:MAG TPA: ABC transporter substrate-binding protein [Saprospiraceae bacterium]|nr:ABC transporter substrate-binding protein [Saprospiraceae bacterium]